MVYKITYIKILKIIIFEIFLLVFLCWFINPILKIAFGTGEFLLAIFPFILLIIIFYIPIIILIINYLKSDWNKKIIINNKINRLQIFENENLICDFELKEIKKIIKFECRGGLNQIGYSTPWNKYYYYKIICNNSAEYYISLFSISKLEKKLPTIPFEKCVKRFPLIPR